VATIDLDSRQKTLTRYKENREGWTRHSGLDLDSPKHFCVGRGATFRIDENEAVKFAGFAEAVSTAEQSHDFVMVDILGNGP
jgi:chromosome partitioning protein